MRKSLLLVGIALLMTATVTSCGGKSVNEDALSASGSTNGHEWVDLGLPSGLKWATCNIGATKVTNNGKHFAWGETDAKEYCTDDNSKYTLRDVHTYTADPKFDCATSIWGEAWYTPTTEDYSELFDNCDYTWTEYNGEEGALFTSKHNGKQIFLPSAGYCNELGVVSEDDGWYWTSTSKTHDGMDFEVPQSIILTQYGYQIDEFPTYTHGLTLRPVTK